MPKPILPALREKLDRGDTEAKREALFQIRNLRSAEASRLALPALKDSNEIVRATAAGSVVFLPPDEAAQALLPLLSDKAEMVRREAAYALGEAGDPSAVTALTALLQRDKIIEVKGAAAVALGKIGDAGAVEPLNRILQDKPDEDREFLRRSAARSIGQIAQFIQTGRIDQLTPQNFLPEKFKRIDKPKYPKLAAQFPAFGAGYPDTYQGPSKQKRVRRHPAGGGVRARCDRRCFGFTGPSDRPEQLRPLPRRDM